MCRCWMKDKSTSLGNNSTYYDVYSISASMENMEKTKMTNKRLTDAILHVEQLKKEMV